MSEPTSSGAFAVTAFEQIRVLFEPLLHVVLHRRAEEAVAVESAEQRRADDGDEQRQREGPLLSCLIVLAMFFDRARFQGNVTHYRRGVFDSPGDVHAAVSSQGERLIASCSVRSASRSCSSSSSWP